MIKRRVWINGFGRTTSEGIVYSSPAQLIDVFNDIKKSLEEKHIVFDYEIKELKFQGRIMTLVMKFQNHETLKTVSSTVTSKYSNRYDIDWNCSKLDFQFKLS